MKTRRLLGIFAILFVCLDTIAASGATLTAVQSRKLHGGVPFDIPIDTTLTISGPVTTESRAIGAGHVIVFQFSSTVSNTNTQLNIVDETGAAVTGTFVAAASNEIAISVASLANGKRLTVSLINVGDTGLNVSASLGFLLGDAKQKRSIATSDSSAFKARSGQSTDGSNYLYDLNTSAAIGAADIAAIKTRAGSALLPCVSTGSDIPDANGQDTNCDGIDGDIARSYFVAKNGLDTNPGTMTQPFLTLAKAISSASADVNRKVVLVAAGVYGESVVLPDGISLYGQYESGRWSRAASNLTTIAAITSNTPALTVNNYVSVGAVEGFTLQAGPAAGSGATRRAVVLNGVQSGFKLGHDVIVAGAGLAGTAGTNGSNGTSGSNGQNGAFGSSSSQGGGGIGGNSSCSTGGSGGSGGYGSNSPGATGASGNGGVNPGSGGAGGASSGCNNTGGLGSTAISGAIGSVGASGAAAGAGGAVTGVTWIAMPGGTGTNGTHGGAGGGGGGGGGGASFLCGTNYGGGGGGGGGAGGCGGTLGTGGQGGGGSIAVLAVNSAVRIENVSFVTSGGAVGGNGGNGGSGGTNGIGGGGGGATSPGAPGGNGGPGGKGGDAGCGGGGAGGVSTGLLLATGSTVANITLPHYSLGPAGPGGLGGTRVGGSCPSGPPGGLANNVVLP